MKDKDVMFIALDKAKMMKNRQREAPNEGQKKRLLRIAHEEWGDDTTKIAAGDSYRGNFNIGGRIVNKDDGGVYLEIDFVTKPNEKKENTPPPIVPSVSA